MHYLLFIILRTCDGERQPEQQDTDTSQHSNDKDSDQKGTKKHVKIRKRLSAYKVSEIILNKCLQNCTKFLAFSNKQREERETNLAKFIVNCGKKVVNEVIATVWETKLAQKMQERQGKTCIELLEDAYQYECKCNNYHEWHYCALQLLANNISVDNFANCVVDLLTKGCGKFRNIMLRGPANCSKMFLLNPLNKVFNTFTNSASTSFAWVGAEKDKVLFLNNFRWLPQIIAWHDVFSHALKVSWSIYLCPKHHFAHNIVFNKDRSIFSTSKHQLVYVKGGIVEKK